MRIASLVLLLSFAPLTSAEESKFIPVCERSPSVRKALVYSLARNCEDITAEELERASNLYFPTPDGLHFQPGDLSGMPNVTLLEIVNMKNLSIDANVLAELPKLEDLKFFGVSIPILKKDMFLPLRNIQKLVINSSEVSKIESGAFNGLANLKILSLDGNDLTVIQKDAFTGLITVREIFLGHNLNLNLIEDGAFSYLPNLSFISVEKTPLQQTGKGAFQSGANDIFGLPASFAVDNLEGWGQP